MPKSRNQTLQSRLKPHEMDAVRESADQLEKSLSEFTREAVLDAVRRVRKADPAEPPLGEWRSQVVERSA